MSTKVFELSDGSLLVIPADTRCEIVSSEPVAQGGDPASNSGELHRLRVRATLLEDSIRRVEGK